MGLFKEKFCYKCEGKVGLLSGISGTDFHICGNCLKKYSANSSSRIGQLKDIPTKEEFDRYLEFCDKNKEELKSFQKTSSFFGFIQIDGYAEKIIFINDFEFERKLLEINPPVYDLDKLLFFLILDKDVTTKKGFLGSHIRIKKKIVLGFENEWFPVACDHTVEEEMEIKEGLFKDTVYMSSQSEDLIAYLIENASEEYRAMRVQLQDKDYSIVGDYTDIQKKYFEQISNISKSHFMSSEMADYLKSDVGNKVTRKKIAKDYNL